jgi:sarcosine/dimethylglycine N-methyltransferase
VRRDARSRNQCWRGGCCSAAIRLIRGPYTCAIDVVEFYETHPINEEQILVALAARGVDLETLRPEDLFDLDQDHYGGLEAVDALAALARIQPDSRVLDVCCGIGGPARYLAHRYGCRVTGIDLTATRVESALRLSAMVGLAGRVRFVCGDAARLPFEGLSFDACIGQEAFVHISDKSALLGECRRVLRHDGRLAFTDWIAEALTGTERARLAETIAARDIESRDGYRTRLAAAGFVDVEDESLSVAWAAILRDRLEMYRGLESETVARFGREHHERYVANYAFFVELVENGVLGGARFEATAR